MAFDGITINAVLSEIKNYALMGRINKIAQPEKDALLLTLKGDTGLRKLYISASASLPLVYFSESNFQSPLQAPAFLMLLRKHLTNARIINIEQPNFERIIIFTLEHLNELGDLCQKKLIIELMGKYSNIIFVDDKDMIIDAIKHVPSSVSSVREVLPGRQYFITNTQNKLNPLLTTKDEFYQNVYSKPMSLIKAIQDTYTGISYVTASEILTRASVDGDMSVSSIDDTAKLHIYNTFMLFFDDVKETKYQPKIYYKDSEPLEYTCFDYYQYSDFESNDYDSISLALEEFYRNKEVFSRIKQKSIELRTLVTTNLERNRKKYDLQLKQLKDSKEREKYRIYGELLHTYGYEANPGDKSLTCINYYTNEPITIPLDRTKTPQENAKRYFDKYNKMKRTEEALNSLIKETFDEGEHLDSVLSALNISESEEDLKQIKEELILSGYIRRHYGKKTEKIKNQPYHYLSSDGFDIYVGKNNLQNDELTFKFAKGNDWWFHAKGMPGSHVVLITNGKEVPDRAFEEAASLAAYYSKGRDNKKVEIDYVLKKEVKKPNGAKPGFVVYYTNYSMTAEANIKKLQIIK